MYLHIHFFNQPEAAGYFLLIFPEAIRKSF